MLADDGLPGEDSRDEAWFRTSRSRSALSRTLSCDSTGASAKPSKTRSASPPPPARPGQGTHNTQIFTRHAPATRSQRRFVQLSVLWRWVLRLSGRARRGRVLRWWVGQAAWASKPADPRSSPTVMRTSAARAAARRRSRVTVGSVPPVQPRPVRCREDRPLEALADRQVDRPGGAGSERDGDDFAALRVMTSVRCPRSAHMASMSASVVSDTRSPSVRRGTQRRPKRAVQVRKNSSGRAAGVADNKRV
jgi:hypothetical protein